MSAAHVIRDRHGVLLRYEGIDEPLPVRTSQVSDRQRIAVLKALTALRELLIIIECLDLSDLGRDRILDALHTIERALERKRIEQ